MEILCVEQPCGNAAEVCYFGSYVTNAETCVKEFMFGGKGKNCTQGKVADLRLLKQNKLWKRCWLYNLQNIQDEKKQKTMKTMNFFIQIDVK